MGDLNRERDLASYNEFAYASAVCFINSNSFKMDKYGDWQFTVTIPREQVADVQAMSKVVGMPMRITVEKAL